MHPSRGGFTIEGIEGGKMMFGDMVKVIGWSFPHTAIVVGFADNEQTIIFHNGERIKIYNGYLEAV